MIAADKSLLSLESLAKKIDEHDAWSRTMGGGSGTAISQELNEYRADLRILLDKMDTRVHEVETSLFAMNGEFGEIKGRLKIIVWLMGGSLLVLVGEFVKSFFPK